MSRQYSRQLRRAARRRPRRTCASCRPSSARPCRAARCRRPPARRRRSRPWPDSWPDAPTARRGRRSRRRAARSRAPRTTACIAARTSSRREPGAQLADQRGGDAHRRVGGLLGAADAGELGAVLTPPARTNASGVDASARCPPARRWSATTSGNSGGTIAALDARARGTRAGTISASIVERGRGPASSSSSRPSATGRSTSMPERARPCRRRARDDRRDAAAVVLGVEERVDDPGRDRVEEVGRELRARRRSGLVRHRDHLQPRQHLRHVAHVVAVVEDRVEVERRRSSRCEQRRAAASACPTPAGPSRWTIRYASSRCIPRSTSASSTRWENSAPHVMLEVARACGRRGRSSRARPAARGAACSRAGSSRRAGRRARRRSARCRARATARRSRAPPGRSRAARARGRQMRSRGDRVALVRHRARALLAGAERLLDLAHLGALEVADLGREALQPGAGERDRAAAARRGGRAGRPGWRRPRRAGRARSSTRAS